MHKFKSYDDIKYLKEADKENRWLPRYLIQTNFPEFYICSLQFYEGKKMFFCDDTCTPATPIPEKDIDYFLELEFIKSFI